MRVITMEETAERQNEWGLTPAYLYNMEKGRIELYEYENEQEEAELLANDWFFHSADDKIVALLVNGAVFSSEETDKEKAELEALKQSTHMRIYKNSEKFLPFDSIRCGKNFEKQTGRRVRHIGVTSLLGDYLRVKVNGEYYRFNEKDCTYVGRWQ